MHLLALGLGGTGWPGLYFIDDFGLGGIDGVMMMRVALFFLWWLH